MNISKLFEKYAEAGVRKGYLPNDYDFTQHKLHPDLLLLIYQRFIYHPPFDPNMHQDATLLNSSNTVLVNCVHDKPSDDLWHYVFDEMIALSDENSRIKMILNTDAVPLLLNYPEKTDYILDVIFSKKPSDHMNHNILQYIFNWDQTHCRDYDRQRLSILVQYQKQGYGLNEDHLYYLERSLGMLAMHKPDIYSEHLDAVEEKHRDVIRVRQKIAKAFQNYPLMSKKCH